MLAICVLAATLLALLPPLRGSAQSGVTYTVTDLGTLGGTQSRAFGINNAGNIVGESMTASSETHPFFWNATTHVMLDLGTFGGSSGSASRINTSDSVVGHAKTSFDQDQAFLWHDNNNNGVNDPGELINLGSLPGGAAASAYDINDSGVVVGTSEIGNLIDAAFVRSGSGMQQIPSASGVDPKRANGVNNAGSIAGVGDSAATNETHGFLVTSTAMIDLGRLLPRPGDPTDPSLKAFSFANAIGEGNYVVGRSDFTSTTASRPTHAFLFYDDNSNSVADADPLHPEMRDLGTLGGTNSTAFDINASQYVVGSADTAASGSHAFVWHDDNANGVSDSGEMKDLNDLLAVGSPAWTLQSATAINDTGRIVGYGLNQFNELHAFLLTPSTPTQPPASSSLAVSGSGVYNGTATLTATLSSNSTPVSGKSISFTLNGAGVCGAVSLPACPQTNASGIATLSGISLTGINPGTYPNAVGAVFAGDASYTGTSSSGTLTVSKADQVINFGALSNKTFGDAPFTVSATGGASANPVTFGASGNCSASGTNGATITITGAGSCTVTASQAGNTNYNAATDVPQSFTIGKANQTITFGPLSTKTFGDAPFTVSASGGGSINPVTFGATGNCTSGDTNGATITLTSAGSCTVTASQAGDTNYNPATPVGQSFTINKASQTITFGSLSSKTFGDAPFTVSATGGGSTSPVTFTATGNCTSGGTNGTTITITAAGGCTVTASQAGDSNYDPASPVLQSFTINQASQTITFGALSNKTFGDPPFTVSATGGASLNPVTFVAMGNCSSSGTNGTTITITSAGSCTVTASQAGNTNYNAAADVAQSFSITCGASNVVTNTQDSGAGSLRNAINVACPGDTITFNIPTTDPGFSGGVYTITLTSELGINKNLTITGIGASALKISRSSIFGTPLMRIFDIGAGNTVNLSGLTITNSIVNDNGGGIYDNGSTVNVTNCVISGNFASLGGGIYLNGGAMTVRNSTISGNSSGGASGGGGILNNGGTLTLINSTINGNSANENAGGPASGGGIVNSVAGTATLTNTTVSGNTASDGGGGILNYGILTITNSTIANNNAAAALLHTGGGIYNFGTANLKNSIIANNTTCHGCTAPDLNGVFNSQDYNLIGDTTGATINGTTAHNITNQNANLGALGNNGGATQTMLPLPGSPVIDAGNVSNLPPDTSDLDGDSDTTEPLPVDQRGFARVSNSKFDIGAVETNYAIGVTVGNSQSTPVKTAFNTQFKATVTESANAKSSISVTFTAPSTGASGTFPGNALTATVNTDNSGVATAPTFTTNGTAGPYNVVASLAAGLPTASFSLTNLKGDQTITFGSLPDRNFGDTDFIVSATASSGLAVSFAASGQCTLISGHNVHLTGAGSCTVTASQAGDTNYNAAADVPQSFTINKALTATAIVSSANPSTAGQSVTFTATVSSGAGTPTGSVVFKVDGGIVGTPNLSAGVASVSVSPAAGTHTVTADYSGDGNFSTSTGTLAGGQVVGGTFQFSQPSYTVGEGAGSLAVTVTRTGDTSGTASVDYRSSDTDTFTVGCADVVNNLGSAYGRCDFATTVGTLSFAAGETAKSFPVPIIDDSRAEGAETFGVILSNATGTALGSPSTATVTINDNETADGANPILRTDNVGVAFFVRMHYLDFLAREPEVGEPWSGILNGCSNQFNTDPNSPAAGCDRLNVSGSFFGSPEFKFKGGYIIGFYLASLNRLPQYSEFAVDLASITGATAAETFAKRAAFANAFVLRPEFVNGPPNAYGAMTNTNYVNTLMGHYSLSSITTPDPASPDGAAKVTLTTTDLINRLNAATMTRAQVLRAIVQSDEATGIETLNVFVASQYYGYLRRTPDTAGFNGWKNYLMAHPTDFRTMVNGFVNSQEYRLRFGP